MDWRGDPGAPDSAREDSNPDNASHESGSAGDTTLPITDEMRAFARQLLERPDELSDAMAEALRGLLLPSPSAAQVNRGLEALAAVQAAAAQGEQEHEAKYLALLPPPLAEWYRTPSWPASRVWLVAHRKELLSHTVELFEAVAARARGAGEDGLAALLDRHGALFAEARRADVDTAYRAIVGEDAFRDDQSVPFDVEALLQQLDEWFQTPDWSASQEYLRSHPNLLTNVAEDMLSSLLEAQREDRARQVIQQHLDLLRDARTTGVDAAYGRRMVGANGDVDDFEFLLNAFFALAQQNGSPARLVLLGHRMLERDDWRTLSPGNRYAVLGTLGNALTALAAARGGAEHVALLSEALNCYEAATHERPRGSWPLEWAAAVTSQANALGALAGSLGGEARQRTLERAAAAYDLALLEYRRDVAPLNWAMTQNNKANALRDLAGRLGGEARQRLLRWIVACHELAAALYPLEILPVDHRRVQRNLASAWVSVALTTPSDEREPMRERAHQAVESALEATRRLELLAPSLHFRQAEWAESASLYGLAATIELLQGRTAEAVLRLEAGRARGLGEVRQRRGADLAVLSDGERAEYERLSASYLSAQAAGRAGHDSLAVARMERDAYARLHAFVEHLSEEKREAFAPMRDLSVEQLAAGLRPGEALLYVMPQGACTLLLAVPNSGPPRGLVLEDLTSDDIFRLAVQPDEHGYNRRGFLPAAAGWGATPLHEALDELLPALDELLPALGDKLMRRAVELVRDSGCRRMVLVPGGVLAVLPLHAATYAPFDAAPATAPGGRRYVCDDLSIVYAPSGAAYLAARAAAERTGAPTRGFVIGNPQLTESAHDWAPGVPGYLRFARLEAGRAARLMRAAGLEVRGYYNGAATWSALKEGLETSDIALLSMHGDFDLENPLESALAVAPGALFFLRSLLDETQVRIKHLRLAILSACKTAQSDFQHLSEEAIGFPGALLTAGAAGVVGSQWSVWDDTTSELMEDMMRGYLCRGLAPDAALRAAQRTMRGLPPEQDIAAAALTMQDTPSSPSVPTAAPRQRSSPWRRLALRGEGAHAVRPPREHPVHWAAFAYYGA